MTHSVRKIGTVDLDGEHELGIGNSSTHGVDDIEDNARAVLE